MIIRYLKADAYFLCVKFHLTTLCQPVPLVSLPGKAYVFFSPIFRNLGTLFYSLAHAINHSSMHVFSTHSVQDPGDLFKESCLRELLDQVNGSPLWLHTS